MASKPEKAAKPAVEITAETKSLSALLSKAPIFQRAKFWIVGNTPLIVHAWSEKAKREMLAKQVKAVKGGREARDPKADYISSLYPMGEGQYGFPVTGVKNAILSVAHKDKGIARSSVMASLFLEAEMIRVAPALAGAVCDLPLVRIWGGQPEMREDMVKIGSGLNKVASLAYRAQFFPWAMQIECRFNPEILTADALAFLIQESGISCGLGEWRNERKGIFGSYQLATVAEEKAWDAFKAGQGPVPVNTVDAIAAE